MDRKHQILTRIEVLKREKPDGWKRELRMLVDELEQMDDPYRNHVYQGDENLGRRVLPSRWSDCPAFDRMD